MNDLMLIPIAVVSILAGFIYGYLLGMVKHRRFDVLEWLSRQEDCEALREEIGRLQQLNANLIVKLARVVIGDYTLYDGVTAHAPQPDTSQPTQSPP